MPTLLAAQGGNAALNGLDGTGTTNVVGFTSQHTATPGTTGASEYASTTRVATTYSAASSYAKANSAGLSFANSGTTPVTHFGGQSASSGSVFSIGMPLGTAVTAASITVAAGGNSITATG